jgi:DNA-binding MarR family transcriptional regulator
MDTSDPDLPVRRLQLNGVTKTLVAAPTKAPFLRGPIPLEWLSVAASLPGKALNVAIALWWRHGMAEGKPFTLTRTALKAMNVERDAASAGLARLEQAGLIRVERKPGRRPTILILNSSRR